MTDGGIDLTIDELVLHGAAPGDEQRIAAAVRGELDRLLRESGLPSAFTAGRDLSYVDGGTHLLARNATAESVGAQVAEAVYRGLGR